MRVNNLTGYNESKSIIVPKDTPSSEIKLFVYVSGDTKSNLSNTIRTDANFKYIEFTTPDYDCHILAKYGNGSDFLRVGEPPVFLMLHYKPYKNETVTYQQFNYDGNIIAGGDMVSIGDNFYVTQEVNVVKSFYVVMGRILTLTLPETYFSKCNYADGNILLQRGKWQLIALPIDGKVGENFVDKLATQEGVGASELIEVCSAYPGHINKFLSYIPGFTLDSSEHNFNLYYTDGDSKEITAFWLKCKNWNHTANDILFSW